MVRAMLLAAAAVLAALASGVTGSGRSHREFSCGECHVSHDASDTAGAPLWAPRIDAQEQTTFQLYTSRHFDALGTDIGQPDGASKLCLSCHDGSYVGLRGGSNGQAVFDAGALARSHPVSFTYAPSLVWRTRGRLKDPNSASSGLGGTIANDLLDPLGKLQCTTCHDVHATGKGPRMLRYEYSPGDDTDVVFCRVCHNQ